MFLEESFWINEVLNKHAVDELSPLLNIGSSSLRFREKVQPFIAENIFQPLAKKNIKVLHTDLQNEIGVDLVGDLADAKFVNQLKSMNFKSIICSNLLEHLEIETRLIVCTTLMNIINEGGLIVMTVPRIYPYHQDPIDTWYRPDAAELAGLFPGFKLIEKKYIRTETSFFSELKLRPMNVIFSKIKLFMINCFK